jgi:carbon storage regulator CsrA
MLVLSRNPGESVRLYFNGLLLAEVTLTENKGNAVRIGITADRAIDVVRSEIDTHKSPVSEPRFAIA